MLHSVTLRKLAAIVTLLLLLPVLGWYVTDDMLFERLKLSTLENLEWRAGEQERQAELSDMRTTLDALEESTGLLRDEAVTLRDELAFIEPRYEALRRTAKLVDNEVLLAASVNALGTQRSVLRGEVAVLRGDRDAIASGLATLAEAFGIHGDRMFLGQLACSPSMLPLLWCDDITAGIYLPVENEVQQGDVIFFTWWSQTGGERETCQFADPRTSSSFIDHRVVRVFSIDGERYYETRGDNNPSADSCFVPHRAVAAKITHIAHGIYPERNR